MRSAYRLQTFLDYFLAVARSRQVCILVVEALLIL
jgi:hypothetical protein